MLKIERGVAPDGKTVAYLVRLGPFADADQAQKRCFSLRRTGYDCVVQYSKLGGAAQVSQVKAHAWHLCKACLFFTLERFHRFALTIP